MLLALIVVLPAETAVTIIGQVGLAVDKVQLLGATVANPVLFEVIVIGTLLIATLLLKITLPVIVDPAVTVVLFNITVNEPDTGCGLGVA